MVRVNSVVSFFMLFQIRIYMDLGNWFLCLSSFCDMGPNKFTRSDMVQILMVNHKIAFRQLHVIILS